MTNDTAGAGAAGAAAQPSAPPVRQAALGRRGQALTAILLVALLATIFGIDQSLGGEAEARPEDAANAIERYGLQFEEISERAGIDFVHAAPELDEALDPIMPLVASMGAAVSVADFDDDGWQDIYTVTSAHGGRNALYRNRGDGTFEDVADAMGLADVNVEGTGVSMGSVWGDADGDGFEDLLLYKWGRPELFMNRGGQAFERATEGAGLPEWVNTNAAIWFDYDRDGWLDIFIGGYYEESLDLWNIDTTRIMPESYEYAENGGRNFLLRNTGGGRFEDVTEAVGLTGTRWTLAAAAVDLRGTGYPDLLVANDYGIAEYWLNEQGQRFREVGRDSGIALRPKSGMNMALGDVFNDGRRALFVTNISAAGHLVQGNDLWLPADGDPAGPPQFTNIAEGAGVSLGGWAFGAQFGDLNNDGAIDLFQTNGYVSADEQDSYWYDMSKVTIGNEAVISDALNWPPIGTRSLSGYESKHVWLNDGLARFDNVAASVGVTERYDGRSIALADFWNRGVLDAVVAHQNGPLLLYRNEVAPERAWIGFDLRGAGPNTRAIGAQVTVRWGGRQQVQDVEGGRGFSSQNQRRLHFGLGEGMTVDAVDIVWPFGAEQTIQAPETGRYHTIREGDAGGEG